MSEKTYWIYILECENNSYYTGYTTDMNKRFIAHLNGTGSKYTRSFKPRCIAQSWKLICEKSVAMQIECRIKKLSRSQKEKLITATILFSELCGGLPRNMKFQLIDDSLKKTLPKIVSI